MQQRAIIFEFVRAEAERLGIEAGSYTVGEEAGLEQGELVFTNENDRWTVYSIERGKRDGVSSFENVMDAIRFFFMKLCVTVPGIPFPRINFNELPDSILYKF